MTKATETKKNMQSVEQDQMDAEEHATENQLPVEEQMIDESSSFVKELEEQKEKYIRLLAEFENYKRRTAKERIDLFKVAGQDIIKELLPALDDIDRAEVVVAEAKDIEAVKKGLQLINEKIRSTLSQKGLKEIDSIGKEFDVDVMESVMEIPAPSDDLKGKVVEVVQKGYTLNDKIIRYPKVVVGK